MPTFELTRDNIQTAIDDNPVLLIDFWADWCEPCKVFGPVFEEAAERHPDLAFATCDVESQQEVAGMFGIRSIPTLGIFKEQILIFSQAGALPGEVLDDIIGKVRELDMDDVRRQIAEQEAAGDQAAPGDEGAAEPEGPVD